jgi:hypothetical protein
MRDTIDMAREAGLFTHKEVQPEIERFAELVRADEREACAKVCDWYVDYSSNPMNFAENCAQEIRARGNT